MSDDLYVGPSVLAPGAPRHPDRLARWLLVPLLVVLVVAAVVFWMLYATLYIAGDSMLPGLVDGDTVLRTRGYDEPLRGDVVMIDVPGSDDEDLVKRVIAVEGDTIEIRDNIALVNGQVEDTSGLVLERGSGGYRDPLVVPEGSVYVMGDNRPISLDSRRLGPVPTSYILGKLTYIILPFGHAGGVE